MIEISEVKIELTTKSWPDWILKRVQRYEPSILADIFIPILTFAW